MMRTAVCAAAALLLVAASSCTGSGKGAEEKIDTLNLTGTLIAGDSLFNTPYGIVASGDRIYVRNSGKEKLLIDEFDADGRYIRSFLKQGSGEGEMPYVDAIRFDAANRRLIVEAAAMYGVLLAIEDLDSNNPTLKTIFSLPERIAGAPGDSVVPANLIRLANGAIITPNLTPAGMLGIYDSTGNFKKIVQPYPPKEELGSDVPDYALANFFQMKGAASPDGKHFAAASTLGDIISFGNVAGDSVDIVTLVGEPQEGIEISEEGSEATIRYNEKLRYFFPRGINVTDSCVYAVIGGYAHDNYAVGKSADADSMPCTMVRVYDYNGNIKSVLRLDVANCIIAVTPDGSKLYALGKSHKNGYQLFRFDL
ncbi:MAG: 6-bladed beta-propeller [Paramuribaculum sp.]|nr:6-bladed beta-propeller [Paramuribaculum sp.]